MSLLSPDDLASLLVFESLTNDWAREVHIFNSKRKHGKTFVIFRNYRNKTISTLEELRLEFDDASFLDNIPFTSGHSHDIVSNKVGAGKIARKAAKIWMEESANRPTENIAKIGFIYRNDNEEKATMNIDDGIRQSRYLISDQQNTSKDLEGTIDKKEKSCILQKAEGILNPTKLATKPYLTVKELSGNKKNPIIKQKTKDVFKSKEHGSSDEECAQFMDKRSSHQNKMYTTTEEINKELTIEQISSNTSKNKEIRKVTNKNLLHTPLHKASRDGLMSENNKTIEKTANESDDLCLKTIENLQSKKDDIFPQSKAVGNIFQKPQKNFKDTESDSDLDTDSDSDSDSEATFKENEKALLIGCKAEEHVLFQTCLFEPADIGESTPIQNKMIQDSDKKLKDEPVANLNLSLNESSDAWMHDYIGSLNDDDSEEESIEKEFSKERYTNPKTIGEDILQTLLAEREVTQAVDKGNESIQLDTLQTMDDADISNGMRKEDYMTLITDQKSEKQFKQKIVKTCTFEPAEENESISIIGKSVEDSNETNFKDEPNLNIHLSLSDSSDAWMHDYVGSMDDDESEDESSSEKETQSPMQSKLNDIQLQIPVEKIPDQKPGQRNFLQTFMSENEDKCAVDINEAAFKPTILIKESTETKMLSLPLHESSNAWMAEDLGSIADDDDSEEDIILERNKILPLQMSSQIKEENKEIQEKKQPHDTGLIDVLQLFLKECDQDMVEHTAFNENAIIKGKDENKNVKEEDTSCLPLTDSTDIKNADAIKENEGTTIEEEKTENSYHIEHTTGVSHDLDENKHGLINVLTTFLKESNDMAISDTGNSKNEFKVERDIIKENDDSTVIDKEDKKGLGKSQNVMEQDQMLSLNKELKNAADTEEDIGKDKDSEEVIPPDKSGLVDVLRTFLADSDGGDVPKPNDDVLKYDVHDEQDPNIDITKQAGVMQPTGDDDQTDSDEISSSDNIFEYGTEDSDLGSSDCPNDPDSDCENESKEDSEPAKNCEH